MKKYILYSLGILLLLNVSCSTENEAVRNSADAGWVTINGVNVKKSDVESPRPKGGLPYGHKVYTFMNGNVGLDEMDKVYRAEFAHKDSLKLDYNHTVKQMGIVFMMHKGLAENGTAQQKKYYVSEELAMEHNIPNLQSFYDLLIASKTIYTNEEIKTIASAFYAKNNKLIKEAGWLTDKDKFLHNLDSGYKKFEDAIASK